MERYISTELRPSNRGVRAFVENSKAIHVLLKLLAVFGVSLIMADGILTPAQSVLGAIQGE
jgi:KUP system potassium uptake protein